MPKVTVVKTYEVRHTFEVEVDDVRDAEELATAEPPPDWPKFREHEWELGDVTGFTLEVDGLIHFWGY